jgi:quercetin dioxygenase-like cupin family protein
MALTHALPGEVVDLRPLGPALGRAKTTALVKSTQFEAVRLVLPEGRHVPSHSVTGQISLLCLEGQVTVHAHTDISLRASEWVYLDRGAPHSLTAILDSSLLLTIHFDI